MASSVFTKVATDVVELIDQYYSSLSAVLDRHAPVITKEVIIRRHSPWFNEELAAARRKRRQVERRWTKSRLSIHLDLLRKEHVQYSRWCRLAKQLYYQQEISECGNDARKMFRITDSLMKGKQERALPTHEDPKSLANDFVEYFCSKIKMITDKFPGSDGGVAHQDVPQLTSFQPVSQDELRKIILSGNSKSCFLDPIPTTLLKECLDCLLPRLEKIVNASLSTSTVPQSLKAASVTPLLKKTGLDADEFPNYRPVSNLPFLSKLIEKCVLAQLDTHMKTNNLQEQHQSAYRTNHSTETALLKITNDLLCEMDKSKCSILIMLDQSAAFDTVNQDILMQRFKCNYGISGAAYDWLNSYFRHRTQAVTVSGESSEPRELVTGFPQGSVLGPFSYPAYTAPLFAIARQYEVNMHMYADDTQMYVSFEPCNAADAVRNLEKCMLDVREWMVQNHLKLNESKTELLIIGNPLLVKRCGVSTVKIGTECVSSTDSAKNIGVVLDSGLTMAAHVSSVTRACYLQLYRISQIRAYLTNEAASTLARSLILSKLDYSNSLLYGLPDVLINKLQLVQNNAARLVKRKKKSDHVTPLLMDLHWLPVEQRILFKVNMITFKALNDLAPAYISELIGPYVPAYNSRASKKDLLAEKGARLKRSGDRAYSICGPKLWNQLPEDIRKCMTLTSFKSALKKHLFQQAFKLTQII